MQKKIIFILLISLTYLCSLSIFASEKRIALVIGNSEYKNMSPLRNPTNDASDISKKLLSFGFQVDTLLNVNYKQMKQAITRFGKKLRQENTVGLFFFAGHGLQVNNFNYLVPIGAGIEDEADVEFEAINANRVLSKMTLAGNRLNLMILDACRNNPLSRGFRSASRGLSLMKPASGSLILYATEPGSVAADGIGKNGLFTEKLLDSMDKNGLKIEEVFKQTAIRVSEASGKKQIPWAEGIILGDFYFNKNKSFPVNINPSKSKLNKNLISKETKVQPYTTENLFWSSLGKSPNIDDYKSYLEIYPRGHFSNLAKSKIKQLSKANSLHKLTTVKNTASQDPSIKKAPIPKLEQTSLNTNWSERRGSNEGYRKVKNNEGKIKLIYSGAGSELSQLSVYKEIPIDKLEGYLLKTDIEISDRDKNGFQGVKLSLFNKNKQAVADFAWSADKYFSLLETGKVFIIKQNINNET
jgi:hypothetical protein